MWSSPKQDEAEWGEGCCVPVPEHERSKGGAGNENGVTPRGCGPHSSGPPRMRGGALVGITVPAIEHRLLLNGGRSTVALPGVRPALLN